MRVAGWREDGRLQAQCREIGQQGQQVQWDLLWPRVKRVLSFSVANPRFQNLWLAMFFYNRWSKWSLTQTLIKVSKNPTPGFTWFHSGPCSTAFTITAGSWRSSASKTFSLGEFVSTSCCGTGGRDTYCGCRCSMLMYLILCLYMFVYLVYLSLLVWTEHVHLILKENLPNFIWIDCMITFCNFLSFPRLQVTCLNTQSPRCNMFHIVSQARCQWTKEVKKEEVCDCLLFFFSLVVFSQKKHDHHKLELTISQPVAQSHGAMAWPWLNGHHFANAQRSRPGFARGICLGSCLEDGKNAWKFWRDSYIIVDYLHHITSPIFFILGMRQIWLWHEFVWVISWILLTHIWLIQKSHWLLNDLKPFKPLHIAQAPFFPRWWTSHSPAVAEGHGNLEWPRATEIGCFQRCSKEGGGWCPTPCQPLAFIACRGSQGLENHWGCAKTNAGSVGDADEESANVAWSEQLQAEQSRGCWVGMIDGSGFKSSWTMFTHV